MSPRSETTKELIKHENRAFAITMLCSGVPQGKLGKALEKMAYKNHTLRLKQLRHQKH